MPEFRDTWLIHKDLYWRAALLILGDRAEAMDAVQDLYVKLWNARDSLSGIRSPEAYGIRLVRNICLDRLRQRKARPPAPESALLEKDSGRRTDHWIIGRETAEAIGKAVGKMNPRQREVFRMKFVEGLDNRTIGRRTGMSAVNVRVTLSRAKSMIRKTLEDER